MSILNVKSPLVQIGSSKLRCFILHFQKKLVSEVLNLNNEVLSSREINRFKRKAKISSTRQGDDSLGTSNSTETCSGMNSVNDKRIKIEENEGTSKSSAYYIDEVNGLRL